MPLPPPMPNALTTSALPSPVVSRSRRTPPRGPETATSTSPFSNTTICRDRPIDSATTSAQKPGGSVSPALSEAHTGLLTCGGTRQARRRARQRERVTCEVSCWTGVVGIYTFPAHTNPLVPPLQNGEGVRG